MAGFLDLLGFTWITHVGLDWDWHWGLFFFYLCLLLCGLVISHCVMILRYLLDLVAERTSAIHVLVPSIY